MHFLEFCCCFLFVFFSRCCCLPPLLSFRILVRFLSISFSVLFVAILYCLVLLDFPSVYSSNTVICGSNLQHENLLGCTPSPFDVCSVCASLHHWRPLALSALDASVSASPLPCGLPTCVAVLFFLCLGPFLTCSLSLSYVPFLCLSFHHSAGVVSSALLSLAVSATIRSHVVSWVRTARHFVSFSVRFLCLLHAVLNRRC